MNTRIRTYGSAALAAVALVLTGCPGGDGTDADIATREAAAPPQPPPPDLRLEVNVPTREVRVFRNDQQIAAYPVAVGREAWPTRPGEWQIQQVIFNPRWVPPAEEWAEDEDPVEPGDPENPLGRVQLVYDPPRSIHGTNQPQSVGQAVSHGSIRVTNETGMELARMVMESGGAQRDEAFFRRAQENATARVDVPIPNPIPIRVINPDFDEAAAVSARAAERGGGGGASPAPRSAGSTGPPASGASTGAATPRDTAREAATRPGTVRSDTVPVDTAEAAPGNPR